MTRIKQTTQIDEKLCRLLARSRGSIDNLLDRKKNERRFCRYVLISPSDFERAFGVKTYCYGADKVNNFLLEVIENDDLAASLKIFDEPIKFAKYLLPTPSKSLCPHKSRFDLNRYFQTNKSGNFNSGDIITYEGYSHLVLDPKEGLQVAIQRTSFIDGEISRYADLWNSGNEELHNAFQVMHIEQDGTMSRTLCFSYNGKESIPITKAMANKPSLLVYKGNGVLEKLPCYPIPYSFVGKENVLTDISIIYDVLEEYIKPSFTKAIKDAIKITQTRLKNREK